MNRLTPEDLSNVKKYFGLDLETLSEESLKEAHKNARKKYHPDNFTKFEDETVIEMAKDRFQQIEILATRLEDYLKNRKQLDEWQKQEGKPGGKVQYATEGIRIDIMTSDKNLKYQLFRTRIIYKGDYAVIPGTQARLISLLDFSSVAATGFRESIKVLLAFGTEDSISDIVQWLFSRISGKTSSFVIEGKVVRIDPYEIRKAIEKNTILELGN
ncbi:MAG: J domain-containing protein [Bacteroidia bacterium]